MRIHSYTPPGLLQPGLVTLPPDESHHLARVLRVAPGQPLSLFDGKGTRAEAVVDTVSRQAVCARILSLETVPPPPVELTLIQALPKPDRFEMVLQKATELGVRKILPVISACTVNRPRDPDKAIRRWHSILLNAAQQCATAWLPELYPPQAWLGALDSLRQTDLAVIGSLQPEALPFRETLRQATATGPLRSAALLIGPEGDFLPEEIEQAVHAGAKPVTFGPQILRTETAAIFGLSVFVYELF